MNCSSDLQILDLQPRTSNFFLKVVQNNFDNKIPFQESVCICNKDTFCLNLQSNLRKGTDEPTFSTLCTKMLIEI